MLISRKVRVNSGITEMYAVSGNYIIVNDLGLSKGFVLMETDGGDKVEMRAGDEVYLKPFKNIFITHFEGVPISVRISVGSGEERFRANTVYGSISVVSGEVERVRQARCFAGFDALASGAAQSPVIQLWNPVGSGVYVVVNKVTVTAQNAEHILLGFQNAPLVTNGAVPQNKNIAKGVGKAQIRKDNYIALAGMNQFQERYLKAFDTQEFSFSEPIILDENRGLIVCCGTLAANTLWGQFQFSEEAFIN